VAYKLRGSAICLFLTAVMFVAALPVCAYESQYADNAKKYRLRWRSGLITLSFSNSLRQNAANIKSGSDVTGAVRRSLATWEAAANIKFVTTWTDKSSISAADSKGDGVSLITVAATPENITPFQNEAGEMPGRTRVFFNRRGEITEADVVLNPYQQFSTDGSFGTFDLEAALTHEIGHLLGLDHSAILAATMYARQGKNGTFSLPAFAPRSLAEDDRAGVRSLYGARLEDEECCGTIGGTLLSKESKPLGNWQVWAEDAATGRLFAGVTSNESGAFTIGGLPAGKYRVVAQAERFSTEFLGEATVENEKTVSLNRKIAPRERTFNPMFVGYNGQLSALAVPLNFNNKSQTIYFGGENLIAEELSLLQTSSPFLQIVQSSLTAQDFESVYPVFSFQLEGSSSTPSGEYNLRWQNKAGESAVLLGGLSVKTEN
jgi:predicted Zn-dependent protease